MQTIYLDISNRGVIPVIYAKQNDVGRKFKAVLTNSGAPYNPEGGSAFSVWYSGDSGMGNYTEIGGKSAFSVSGNEVTVEMIAQMLQNAGEGFLCLVLNSAGGNQLGMWNITYICEAVPGAGSEAAQQYYTAFSEAVAGLAYPDVSLSAPGKAADAAAVGTALAGKAPAGYGLGESAPSTTIEDCNTITQNGWYRTSGSTLNQPLARANWMRVDSHGTSYCHQTWFNDQYSGCIDERFMLNGVWQPWEWVNPPMALGVEYRTTERCEGMPVYAKRINCLSAPASVSISDLNIEKVVRWSGFVTYYGVALPCSIASWKVDINRTTISTTSAYEQASAHFYIDLYYTKT